MTSPNHIFTSLTVRVLLFYHDNICNGTGTNFFFATTSVVNLFLVFGAHLAWDTYQKGSSSFPLKI